MLVDETCTAHRKMKQFVAGSRMESRRNALRRACYDAHTPAILDSVERFFEELLAPRTSAIHTGREAELDLLLLRLKPPF